MYEAHVKREAVERLTDVKNAMVAGLWANSNLDDGKNTRQKMLQDIEETFSSALHEIYTGRTPEVDVDLKNDPFFAAMKIPGEEPQEASSTTVPDRTTTTEKLREIEVDQA